MPKVQAQFSSQIPRNQKGHSLGSYLSLRFAYLSLEEWESRAAQGLLLIDGQPARLDALLSGGESMLYIIRDYEEPEIPTSWEWVAETDDYLLVGKSAGQPIQRTGRIIQQTLSQTLRDYFSNEDLSPLFRLDRETSGLMVFAKHPQAAQVAGGAKHGILGSKLYLAVVGGQMTHPQRCQLSLSERSCEWVRGRMVVDDAGKSCHTDFWPLGQKEDQSLVLCQIHTGRKHQIRAHLEALGYPIVGDKIYGHSGEAYARMAQGQLDEQDLQNLGAEYQMLHAWMAEVDLGQGMQWFESKHWSGDFAQWLEMSDLEAKLRSVAAQIRRGEWPWWE